MNLYKVIKIRSKINASYRIVLEYKNKYFPIMWLKAGKDGSIYTAPYMKPNQTRILYNGSTVLTDERVEVKYSDKVEVDESLYTHNPKMSFHSSGIVHGFHKNSKCIRKCIRGIKDMEHLCYFMFQHPSSFSRIDNIRKRDVVINYGFKPDYPIYAQISIAPLLKNVPLGFKDTDGQINIILEYKNLDGMCDISVQIALYTKRGHWAPHTYIIYPLNN